MKLSETELKGMTKGKDEAVRYVKREKRMYQLYNAYYQIAKRRCDEAFTVHEGRLRQAEVNRTKVIEEARARLAVQSERQKEIKQIKEELGQITKTEAKLTAEFEKLNQSDSFLRGECKFKTEDEHKYQKKLEDLKNEYTKILQESKEANEGLPKLME